MLWCTEIIIASKYEVYASPTGANRLHYTELSRQVNARRYEDLIFVLYDDVTHSGREVKVNSIFTLIDKKQLAGCFKSYIKGKGTIYNVFSYNFDDRYIMSHLRYLNKVKELPYKDIKRISMQGTSFWFPCENSFMNGRGFQWYGDETNKESRMSIALTIKNLFLTGSLYSNLYICDNNTKLAISTVSTSSRQKVRYFVYEITNYSEFVKFFAKLKIMKG